MARRRTYNPEAKRRSNLRLRYGITPEEFDALAARTRGKCPICLKKKRLAVDHCHKTGRVRGLICSECNRSIGMLGDQVEPLRRALKYLEEHYGERCRIAG